MSPQETVQILKNHVASLTQQRETLVQGGDLERVLMIDADIASTNTTLNILQSAISE